MVTYFGGSYSWFFWLDDEKRVSFFVDGFGDSGVGADDYWSAKSWKLLSVPVFIYLHPLCRAWTG